MLAALLFLLTVSPAVKSEWSVLKSVQHLSEIIDNADTVDIVFPKHLQEETRKKRDTTADHHNSLLVNEWILDVVPNEDLILGKGSFETEWVNDDGVIKTAVGDDGCTMERGKVRGDDGSLVAVTVCEGGAVTGMIQIGGDLYFIEPLIGVNLNTHLLYKAKRMQIKVNEDVEFVREDFEHGRNVSEGKIVRKKRESYLKQDEEGVGVGDHPEWVHRIIDESDKKGTSDGNETVGFEEKRERRPKYEEDDDEVGYFLDTVWEKDPIISRPNALSHSPQRWLEIAIAVDHSVIAFHGKDRVQQYVLALMNIVSAIYKDPSLASNLKLVIVRMLFYEDKKHGEVRVGNSKRSLENVNRWNDRTSRALPAGSARHDVAVWLTRLDLGGPSGYAPVSGACDSARSCTLNRDEGLTSSFIIAHELAHVLGLTHDGDPDAGNACSTEATLGSVMAPMVSATFHRFTWSTCSRAEFHNKTAAWQCLSNAPSKSANTTHLKSTLQSGFTMDEQCRMEFGDGFSLCRSFDLPEPCAHLWCGHVDTPLVCKTKKGPPLEGTECGVDRWCVNGYCEALDRRRFGGVDPVLHNPSDGGWSAWGAWTACSRPCGGGVNFRVRRCDNPRPAYGGDNCVGRSEEFRVCNYRACAEPLRDFRAQQCARLPTIGPLLGLLGHRVNQTWLPHEADQKTLKCQLTCVSREAGDVFLTGENLLDGTPCSYDTDNDICIQGECQSLGCDGELDSTLGRDSCGVCGGNNSLCHTVTQAFNKTLRRAMTRMAVLPRLARDIRVIADATLASRRPDLSPIKMVLRDRRRRIYNLTAPEDRFAPTRLVPEARATLVVEGARFHYERRGSNEVLWARGPLLAELVVSVTVDDFETTTALGPAAVAASVSYVLHADHPRGRHAWQTGGWGPCSKSCGGGKRARTIACRDTQTNRIVAKRNCPLISKPDGQYESCNDFGCDARWQAATWEHCSATCGPSGVQHRQVFCLANDTAIDKHFVDPALCESADKPTESRPCNRMPCPAHWLPGNWSECSSSCGRGFETLSYHCPASPLECGVAPTPERRPCKERRDAAFCTTPRNRECKRDASKYCRLTSLLGRYCVVPGYRRLCCMTCRHAFNELPVQIRF